MPTPILLIAASASGQGKTTVAAGLARWYTRQGLRVRVFKCGPDFLDPGWLALASAHPVHSLDLWLTGEADIRARLHEASQNADVILIEGVMGLFDGAPSAADLALRWNLPLLAVVDASSMAGTFGAIVKGLRTYRAGLRWAGVLANRVGSEAHAQMLQDSLSPEDGWLGAIPRDEAITVPERHLGLTHANESVNAMAHLDAVADAIAQTPLGQAMKAKWRDWLVHVETPQQTTPIVAKLKGQRIAVARDAAFCFIYPANIDTLEALGAKCVWFSPLHDKTLPPCDAVWLPGGYPELHAALLSANGSMRESIRAHVQDNQPVWAECGGMMALFDSLQTVDGITYPMWGILKGQVNMQKRLAALGPQQWVLINQDDSSAQARCLRGHTFHYSTVQTSETVVHTTQSVRVINGVTQVVRDGEAIYQNGSVKGSYFHPWFASDPDATAQLFVRVPVDVSRSKPHVI